MDTIASNATSAIPRTVASVLPMPFVNRPVFGVTGAGAGLPGSTTFIVILLFII